MTSLYDLLGSGQTAPPAQYDVYDAPGVGLEPVPTPATQAGMGGTKPSLAQQLLAFLKTQQGMGASKPPGGAAVSPLAGYLPPDQPGQASQAGFLSNSQHGVDLATIMKLAAIVGTAGAAAPAVAGVAGAGTGAAAGAGGLGGLMGGGGGAMGMLGGIFGGGEKKAAPSPVLMGAPQINTTRLYG